MYCLQLGLLVPLRTSNSRISHNYCKLCLQSAIYSRIVTYTGQTQLGRNTGSRGEGKYTIIGKEEKQNICYYDFLKSV